MSHRIARYKGKPLWSGLINVLDNHIEEVHPFSEARNQDFHHSFYVSPAGIEKMNNDEAQFFWIDRDADGKTTVNTDWRQGKNEDVENALIHVLDLSDTNDYDDSNPEYEAISNIVEAIKGW